MKKRNVKWASGIIACGVCILTLSGCKPNANEDPNTKNIVEQENNMEAEAETVKQDSNTEATGEAGTETETTSDMEQADTEVLEEEENTEPTTLHFVDAWGEWHDTEINPNLNKHAYDWTCLKNDGQNISYEGDERYTIRKGIDVSYHQGEIDWKKVKADGYEFAIIRVAFRGYGESGSLNLDKCFHTYVKQAHEAGLDVGVYIFSQAINEEEASEEADFVIEALQGITLELPVVFDPELIRDSVARTDDVTGEQFTANTITFCEKVKQAGYEPMIYSNMVWEAELFDLEQLQEYPIWYADYELTPQTPYAFQFWQYSESGKVDGIEGNVDLDVQFIPQ
ncbi:glycoside hydrolase family 25 protein [Anaerosporobacter faecicola]|uniref:glycoside hydrolase family 25 protein n=1 Tax=Anaerosporobacter faecicola TaxID=2718714 RepID=UPI001EE52660|nr:glycoside hydrolase family 25 protein [Anaerosporobacter faecicola]